MSCNNNTLGFFKLSENAYAPFKGSPYSAGYDLISAYEYTVPAHNRELIKTDLSFSFPEGTYGRIAPRSGLAYKNFIDVGAGVVDRDYTGNVCVLLYNHSSIDFKVKRGDRIAQLICEKICETELVELSCQKPQSERGDKGFGSTGL